jgi:polar amino acid transport system substrate-binding protein
MAAGRRMAQLGSIGTFLLGVALAAGCGRSDAPGTGAGDQAEQPDCVLTMGWEPWEPYHYLTPTGEIWGFDVQLARTITERAGCKIDFERDSWSALLVKIASGEIDFISGATATPEREAFALFSEPYRSEDFALYVRSGEAARWAGDGLRSLLESGMRIGVTDSYIYGDEITALQDDPEFADSFVPAATGDVNLSRLLDGAVDGFVEDIFVATASIRRRGLEEEIAVHPLVMETGGEVSFMFSRASTPEDVVARFNEALKEIEASGRYKEIEDRYLR